MTSLSSQSSYPTGKEKTLDLSEWCGDRALTKLSVIKIAKKHTASWAAVVFLYTWRHSMQSRTGVKLLWIKVEGNSTSDPVCVVSLAIVSSRNAFPVGERLLFTRIRTNLWTDEFLCKFRDRLQHCWPFKNLHGSLGSRIFARFCLFKILCGPV